MTHKVRTDEANVRGSKEARNKWGLGPNGVGKEKVMKVCWLTKSFLQICTCECNKMWKNKTKCESTRKEERRRNACHQHGAVWRSLALKPLAGCGWLSSKPVFYWFPWAVLWGELCAASPSFTGPRWLGARRADGTCSNAVTATWLWFTPLTKRLRPSGNVQIFVEQITHTFLFWAFNCSTECSVLKCFLSSIVE